MRPSTATSVPSCAKSGWPTVAKGCSAEEKCSLPSKATGSRRTAAVPNPLLPKVRSLQLSPSPDQTAADRTEVRPGVHRVNERADAVGQEQADAGVLERWLQVDRHRRQRRANVEFHGRGGGSNPLGIGDQTRTKNAGSRGKPIIVDAPPPSLRDLRTHIVLIRGKAGLGHPVPSHLRAFRCELPAFMPWIFFDPRFNLVGQPSHRAHRSITYSRWSPSRSSYSAA